MELPKTKTAVNVGVVMAAVVTTVALGMAVWPALTRPDPPAEATGDGGLRIRLVQPPKAAVPRGSPLDVRPSDADQASINARQALFDTAPPAPPTASSTPAPQKDAPVQAAEADEENLDPPPGMAEAPVERDSADSGYELAQRRWAEERQARRERRAAWEQAQSERRHWEEDRERDRYDEQRHDDRYEPSPPPDDDRPPPGWR